MKTRKVTRHTYTDLGGWNLWRDGLSPTAIITFLACVEQFRLGYCLRYEPKRVPVGPAFGRLIHHLLDMTLGKRSKPPDRASIKRLAMAWERKNQKFYQGMRERETLALLVGLGIEVFTGYVQRYRDHWTRALRWRGFEVPFELPYQYPDGRTVRVRGRFDAILESAHKLWIQETKCWAVIKAEEIVAMLPWDFQFNYYIYALSQLNPATEIGGLVLNVVRRPGHTIGKTETRKHFFERIAKDVMSPARWDHNFRRFEHTDATRQQIADWKAHQLDPIMADIRAWFEKRRPHYVNPTGLVNQYGPCFMFNPIALGDFTMHVRKERGHGKGKA